MYEYAHGHTSDDEIKKGKYRRQCKRNGKWLIGKKEKRKPTKTFNNGTVASTMFFFTPSIIHSYTIVI